MNAAISNIKHLLSSLKSKEAKIRCELILSQRSDEINEAYAFKLRNKLQKNHLIYHAAETMERISFKHLNNFYASVDDLILEAATPDYNKINVSKEMKILKQYAEKTVHTYLKLFLHEKAAHFLLNFAEDNYKLSERIKEKSDFFKNKSSFEKSKFAHTSAKKFKAKGIRLLSLYGKTRKNSLLFWQQAAKLFAKGERPGLSLKVSNRYHEIIIKDYKEKRSPAYAFRKAIKYKWYNLADSIARELNNKKMKNKCAVLIEKNTIKFVQSGEKHDFQSRLKLKKIPAIKKSLDVLSRGIDRNKNILFNLLLHPFNTINYLLKKRKASVLSCAARQDMLIAREAFLKAGRLGKVSELDNKILPLEKRCAMILEESALQRINGEIAQINKLIMDTSALIEELSDNNYPKLRKVIKTEKAHLERIVLINKKADILEMKADETDNHNVKIKILTKAMFLYEKASLFKQALEIAKKIEKKNLVVVYQKIISD